MTRILTVGESQLVASHCRMPIIFISAHGDSETRARALEAGAVAFLQKPFPEAALLSAINLSLTIYKSGPSD